MIARHLMTAVLVSLVLGGCAIARTGEDRFSYTPTVTVKQEDYDQCNWRARSAASSALAEVSSGAENFAAFTGALGALLALEYASSVEQSAYKEAFETCLKEKGYDI